MLSKILYLRKLPFGRFVINAKDVGYCESTEKVALDLANMFLFCQLIPVHSSDRILWQGM